MSFCGSTTRNSWASPLQCCHSHYSRALSIQGLVYMVYTVSDLIDSVNLLCALCQPHSFVDRPSNQADDGSGKCTKEGNKNKNSHQHVQFCRRKNNFASLPRISQNMHNKKSVQSVQLVPTFKRNATLFKFDIINKMILRQLEQKKPTRFSQN